MAASHCPHCQKVWAPAVRRCILCRRPTRTISPREAVLLVREQGVKQGAKDARDIPDPRLIPWWRRQPWRR